MNAMMMTITFESKFIYLPVVRKVIRGIGSDRTSNEQYLNDIELSVHEALSNVIDHAYNHEPHHQIELTITWSDQEIVIQIRDTGIQTLVPLSPILQDFDVNNLESIAENGRGLFFIYHLMDDVTYARKKGVNILILRKSIHK